MKPDSNNTGSVESIPKMDNLNIQKNKIEIKKTIRTESEPEPAISKPHTSSHSALQTLQKTTTKATSSSNDDSDKKETFENKISNLEANTSRGIESHWVELAEEVMDKTSNDPYFQDDAQHALSKAYLKKRFGLIIE